MLPQDVLDGGKDTDQNISARSLTLFIFAVGWAMGIGLSTTTQTHISDATAVTFCVKCINPLKLYPLSENIFRKWFASYFLFIHAHSRAFNNNVISNGKSYCCNNTFTDIQFTSLLANIFKKNTNYFYAVRTAFH